METLSEWLKQIIFVVLLATFIDLLLPNSTMQRYVKLVVSLFILMTILTPVLDFLGMGANLRLLASSVDGFMAERARQETAQPPGGDRMFGAARSVPALSEVLEEGEQMRRSREQKTMSMLEEKLASMVEQSVKNKYGVENVRAEAKLDLDADGLPVIRSIRIVVGASDGGEQSVRPDQLAVEPIQPIGPIEPVKPIEPVTVAPFGKEPVGKEPVGAPAASAPEALETNREQDREQEKERKKLREEIRRDIAANWNADARRVVVEFAGE